MDGQMTIFDFIEEPKDIPLNDLSDDEMAKRISDATGLNFKLIPDMGKYLEFKHPYYEAKMGPVRYEVYFDYYMETQKKFISVGFTLNHAGGGAPCDSLTEAINKIKKYKERIHHERME